MSQEKVFVLTIEDTGNNNFSVYPFDEVENSFTVPFLDDPIRQGILNLHGRREFGLPTTLKHETVCAEVGEFLFHAFITSAKPAHDRYLEYRQQNDIPRIALQIPRSLYYLPWEVIRDPRAAPRVFLSRQGSVTRCDLRSKKFFDDWPASSVYMSLMANTRNDPFVPFKIPSKRILKFSTVDPATYDNFGKKLKKWQPGLHGFVFFGHGDVYEGEGYINFVKDKNQPDPDPKPGLVVASDIEQTSNIRIAYILACESAWVDQKTSFEYSIAGSILLTTRLAFVVGAQTKIDSFAAQVFFKKTVDALTDNYPLDLALAKGRRAVYKINEREKGQKYSRKDWWVPVVYAKTTDFNIWPRPQPTDRPASGTGILGAIGRQTLGLFSSDNDAVKDLVRS